LLIDDFVGENRKDPEDREIDDYTEREEKKNLSMKVLATVEGELKK